MLSIIGNKGWFEKGGEKPDFDQQPIDAGYFVDAFAKDDWYNALGPGVTLGKHFTIDKNGKVNHYDGNGKPITGEK